MEEPEKDIETVEDPEADKENAAGDEKTENMTEPYNLGDVRAKPADWCANLIPWLRVSL